MVSSILPQNERWDNFHYIKLSQRSFFGRIEDIMNCFRDLLTFSCDQTIICKEKALELTYVRRLLVLALDLLVLVVHSPST